MHNSNPFTKIIATVNPDTRLDQTTSRFPEAAQEAVRQGRDAAEKANVSAKEVTDAAKEAAKRATDTAKHIYQLSAVKAEETLAISKEYVRRNPVPVFFGAIAVGAALGYMVMMTRRKPTFGERYADEPMAAVREALLGAFAPVTQRVHSGYDSALTGAEKAMDRMHRFGSGNSFSHRIGRIGNNLKFW